MGMGFIKDVFYLLSNAEPYQVNYERDNWEKSVKITIFISLGSTAVT